MKLPASSLHIWPLCDTMALLQAAARAVEKVAAVAKRAWQPVPKELAIAALAGAAIVFAGYTVHSVWVRQLTPATSTSYSGIHFRACLWNAQLIAPGGSMCSLFSRVESRAGLHTKGWEVRACI